MLMTGLNEHCRRGNSSASLLKRSAGSGALERGVRHFRICHLSCSGDHVPSSCVRKSTKPSFLNACLSSNLHGCPSMGVQLQPRIIRAPQVPLWNSRGPHSSDSLVVNSSREARPMPEPRQVEMIDRESAARPSPDGSRANDAQRLMDAVKKQHLGSYVIKPDEIEISLNLDGSPAVLGSGSFGEVKNLATSLRRKISQHL